MSSKDQPPSGDIDNRDDDIAAEDRQEALEVARIWAAAVLVAVVFASLFYTLLSAAFDFHLSSYWHLDRIVAWLWVNCGAIGLGIRFWKSERFPIARDKWLRGRRARRLILAWLGGSLAWFMLPVVLRDVWGVMSAWLNGW